MAGVPRAWAVLLLLVATAVVSVVAGAAGVAVIAGPVAAPPLRLPDLENTLVDPFQSAAGGTATVFVFVSVDCPISNRYAPEVRRLYEAFAAKGVTFWLVYPNPRESSAQIRAHLKAYGYPVGPNRALRDPKHELVTLTKALMTPEAALYDRKGTLAYHGRIDNRYASLSVERPSPTERDLQDAIAAVVAGKAVAKAAQPAVGGCYIADFLP